MKKTILRAITILGFLAVIVFVMIQLNGCQKKEEKPAVTIGYFNNITHAQALLMKAEGNLEQAYGEAATVQYQSFNAGPAEVEALFSEDIDIGYIGPVPALTANVKSDADVCILSGATKGGAVLLRRQGENITSAADLAGKTVAIPQIGNTQHLSLLQLISENNLKPDTEGGTVRVTAVSNADVANMMERGDIDAALVPEPWGTTLQEQGAELVLDYDELFMDGTYDVAVVVVRKEFMQEHPELVEKFLEIHKQATETIQTDQENALKLINEEINRATGKALQEDVLRQAFTRIKVDDELNKESVEAFAKISKEQGFIDKEPAPETLYIQ